MSLRKLRSRSFRALCATAVVGLLMTAWLPGAGSKNKDAFVGAGLGRALRVGLFGLGEETQGFSTASVNSTPVSSSEGYGSLTFIDQTGTKSTLATNGAKRDPATGEKCGAPVLSVPPPLALTVGTACSVSSTKIAAGYPTSHADASVSSIDLDASSLFASVVGPLAPVLDPVFGAVPPPIGSTLSDLVDSLKATKTLAVRLGDSSSTVTSSAASLKVDSLAKAGHIDILPASASAPFGPYFIRIVIGSASAHAQRNNITGVGDSSFDPAVVTVKFAPIAGSPVPDVTVAPGQTIELPLPAPFQSTITMAAGDKFERPDGSVAAFSDGVKIHLFKGINESAAGAADGGLLLELAHAEAAVVGTPLVVTKAATPKSVPVGDEFTTRISVTNPSDCPIEHVSVVDKIDVHDESSRFKYVSSSPEADAVPAGENLKTGTVAWNDIGTIAPGATKHVDVTLLAQVGAGRIVDVATASGKFGKCPASAGAQADVIASALSKVPVYAQAALTVPTELPRTGPSPAATMRWGLALVMLGLVGARGLKR